MLYGRDALSKHYIVNHLYNCSSFCFSTSPLVIRSWEGHLYTGQRVPQSRQWRSHSEDWRVQRTRLHPAAHLRQDRWLRPGMERHHAEDGRVRRRRHLLWALLGSDPGTSHHAARPAQHGQGVQMHLHCAVRARRIHRACLSPCRLGLDISVL